MNTRTITTAISEYCRQLERIIDEYVNAADVTPAEREIVLAIQTASDAQRKTPRKAGDSCAIPMLK